MGLYARMERLRGVANIMEFVNDFGTLRFHRKSLKGKVEDFVFTYCKKEGDIGVILHDSYQLFQELMKMYDDKIVKARLVAKVDFEHILSSETRTYHFASLPAEVVIDPRDFFEKHMNKISERLDNFNEHGSNLVIKSICCIYIQLSCKDRTND